MFLRWEADMTKFTARTGVLAFARVHRRFELDGRGAAKKAQQLQETRSGTVAACRVVAYGRGDQPDRLQRRRQCLVLDSRTVDLRRVEYKFVDCHADSSTIAPKPPGFQDG